MPTDLARLRNQIDMHYAAGRFDAIEALLRGVDAAGLDDPLLMLAANAAIQSNQLTAADRWLATLRGRSPDNPSLRRVHGQVLNRLGLAASTRGDGEAAIAYFEQALRTDPGQSAARLNLALEWRKGGQGERAVRLLADLVREDVDNAALRAQLIDSAIDTGLACIESGDTDAASRLADLCLAAGGLRAPAMRAQLALRLKLPSVLQDADAIAEARTRWEQAFARLRSTDLGAAEPRLSQLAWSNFGLAYHGKDDLALQSIYGDWLVEAAARMRPDLAMASEPPARTRKRVVLPSSHWCDCTAGHYFASWIGMLAADPSLEVHVLAVGPRLDAFTDTLATPGVTLHRLAAADSDAIADAIAALQPDLVIYPELGMDVRLLPVAAMRLAPVQAMAWGHPVTSGLSTMDAYLGCAEMEPESAQAHYRESLHLLPGIGTRYVAPARPPSAARAALGLPEGALVVVPQSAAKIHPDNDAVYRQMLAANPSLHLLFFDNESAVVTARLRDRIVQGLPTEAAARLSFHPLCARERFLQVLGACDLMLDPLHWSGGNTALDALRMDLPIVAAPGAFMRSRQSAAMLERLGLSESLLTTPDGLARRCLDLLASGDLPSLRRRIAAGFDALVDGEGVDVALRQIVQRLLGSSTKC